MTDSNIAPTSKQKAIAADVVQRVCELPDYNSPDDQPDLVMCTVQELEACVLMALERSQDETSTGCEHWVHCPTCGEGLKVTKASAVNQDGRQTPAPSGHAGLGTAGGASSPLQSSEKATAAPEPITCQICYGQGGRHQDGCALNGSDAP